MNTDYHTTACGSRFPGAEPAVLLPGTWVSSTVRRLEPWAARAIAGGVAVGALLVWPGPPQLWLLCLFALGSGQWARARPARRQCDVALRGALLLACALALDLQAAPAALHAWIGVICIGYGFLLRPAWALALTACAMAAIALSAAQHRPDPASAGPAVEAGLLLLAALCASGLGAVVRRTDALRESRLYDGQTLLCNQEGLLAYGDELLQTCRGGGRPATMAVFDCGDLLEVRSIYGRRVSRILLAMLVQRLRAIAGEHGIAARTGPAQFAVMLPGANGDQALRAIQRVLGSPSRIELEAGDSEIVLVPEFTIEAAGVDRPDASSLYSVQNARLARLREVELRRQRRLCRARERHARPMEADTATWQAARSSLTTVAEPLHA